MDRLYRVNVRGVFNMSKAFIGQMLARQAGVIVNIASIGGVVGIRDRLAYATTKTAVVGMTKAWRMDHASDGMRVNCVCPGRVETPFVEARLQRIPRPGSGLPRDGQHAGHRTHGQAGRDRGSGALPGQRRGGVRHRHALMIDGGWSMSK